MGSWKAEECKLTNLSTGDHTECPHGWLYDRQVDLDDDDVYVDQSINQSICISGFFYKDIVDRLYGLSQ